jgi:hypothetical protein
MTPAQHRKLAAHYRRRWLALSRVFLDMPLDRIGDYFALYLKFRAHENAANWGQR